MERNHTIYAFVDQNKKPFYIGRTWNLKKRIKEHLYEVKNGNTLPKYNKLRKLLEGGEVFNDLIVVLEENISSELIENKEIFYIAKLREEGYKLKNLTDGGEGAINTIPGLSEKLRKIHTGSKRSKETRKKISEAKLGVKFSDEHKKNLSIARKKRITKLETREKTSKTSKGKINIKEYILIDPNGVEHVTTNGLKLFCEQHDLTHPNFFKVLSGERTHVKGWTIKNKLK
jgi:hypothetical protein